MPQFCEPFEGAQLGAEHQSKGRSLAVELPINSACGSGHGSGRRSGMTTTTTTTPTVCARRSRRSSSRHRCFCCCRCTRAHRLLRRARDIEGEHVYNAARSFSSSSMSISLYSHKLSLLILYYTYFTLLYSLLCLLSEHVLYAPLCAQMYLSLSHIYPSLYFSYLSLSRSLSLL